MTNQSTNVVAGSTQSSPSDDHQHRGSQQEPDEVGGGRAEALAGQLVGRQAAAEEHDDGQQRRPHTDGRRLVPVVDNDSRRVR